MLLTAHRILRVSSTQFPLAATVGRTIRERGRYSCKRDSAYLHRQYFKSKAIHSLAFRPRASIVLLGAIVTYSKQRLVNTMAAQDRDVLPAR